MSLCYRSPRELISAALKPYLSAVMDNKQDSEQNILAFTLVFLLPWLLTRFATQSLAEIQWWGICETDKPELQWGLKRGISLCDVLERGLSPFICETECF